MEGRFVRRLALLWWWETRWWTLSLPAAGRRKLMPTCLNWHTSLFVSYHCDTSTASLCGADTSVAAAIDPASSSPCSVMCATVSGRPCDVPPLTASHRLTGCYWAPHHRPVPDPRMRTPHFHSAGLLTPPLGNNQPQPSPSTNICMHFYEPGNPPTPRPRPRRPRSAINQNLSKLRCTRSSSSTVHKLI